MQKILMRATLFLFLMTGFGIFSCQEDDCDFSSNTFSIVGYNGFVAEGPDDIIFGGAEGEFAIEGEPFHTTYDSLLLIYQAFVTRLAIESTKPNTIKGGLLGNAFADCGEPAPIQMVNFIDSIYIESTADYTANLPAGSDLINIFSIRQFNDDVGFLTPAQSVPEFLAQNTATRATSFAVYRPTQPPSADKTHQFYISIWHRDGQQYDFNTGEIVFP